MEKALFHYKGMLKRFYSLESTNKEYNIVYYKLCGMETILESFGVELAPIQSEIYTLIRGK